MKAQHVERLMEARADKPDSANALRKVLREMMKVAIKLGWRDDDPTQGGKEDQAEEERWLSSLDGRGYSRNSSSALGHGARTLHRAGGQDVILMGEQHIRNEVLDWVRKKTEDKTGFELAIPVHPELRRIIDATPSKHLTFLAPNWTRRSPPPASAIGSATVATRPGCGGARFMDCARRRQRGSPTSAAIL